MLNFLSDKFTSIFSRLTKKGVLSEAEVDQTLEQVRQALLEADVPYELATAFIAQTRQAAIGQKVLNSLKPGEQLVKVVHDKIKEFLGGDEVKPFSFVYPATVMVLGLQGSGKTTTLGKLAYLARQSGVRSVLLASVDFYRPAAIDQLEQLAARAGVSFFRATSADPVVAARQIEAEFRARKYDLLLLDTAGRMHIDGPMIKEVCDVAAAVRPKHTFLVLDAMTGQESLAVARAFHDAVGFDGAILSKMDSDTRGGAAFSFRYALHKPIICLGVGEKIEDIEWCRPDRMAGRILGMGDVRTLLEKADVAIKKEEQEKAAKAVLSDKMTLQDFADQLEMISRIGSLSSLMGYMPGLGDKKISPEMIEQGDRQMKRFKAIMNSMTPRERADVRILNGSRKQRIARGAGTTPVEVNNLLKQFEQMQQYAKLMKRFGGFKRFFGSA